jgi:NAD(P)-dependent dehydrogenase (short-subunit alcohol dehydrogenase family)
MIIHQRVEGSPKGKFAMDRCCVVTGAASGIGLATTRHLRARGDRVITCDLHDADVLADLVTPDGRAELVTGVARESGGKIDAIIANAGGGPPRTSVSLNFFGAVATLEGLRPLLAGSAAPRAVVVSSVASLRPPLPGLVEACLSMDEAAAIAVVRDALADQHDSNSVPVSVNVGLDLYGGAKLALQHWCRSVAVKEQWAGAGIALNIVALGFFDTPAAAYVLSDVQNREAMARLFPLRGAFPGRPEEAAALLDWCVSAENSQMTGQILFADAGLECAARGALTI